ncbi:MAG: thiolase domain-containing protein [Deltaproteobacteria bacterium]|nr:MAG: thiolase domain-containing protein [Deltaproteobacteria bacterium]
MRSVAIAGIGQTPVQENWEKSLKELAGDAIFAALQDAESGEVDAIFVGNMLSGTSAGQAHLGTLLADWIGARGVEAIKVESACSSGGSALRLGMMAVASGECESVLVVGVEKMTEVKGPQITAALATAADADWEVAQGVSFVALNALLMRRYMHEYGWKHEDFAPFSINAHENALHNPFARFHERLTLERYQRAPMVSSPINLMDASPTCDGAAAVLLTTPERARRPGRPTVQILGSATATDTIAVHDPKDPTWLKAAEESAKAAYAQAGITPEDVDLFEAHDAFSIMAALSLEACGFAERGQGPRLGLEGEIRPNGRIPIATRGGLKGRGHPVGATGVYQVVEAAQQLRGECGETQVADARIAMTQNIGGSGATIVTHILGVA